MKMFYDKEELKNLSPEELIELSIFGDDDKYFYKDLESLKSIGDEYVFTFKNGTRVYTKSVDVYNTILLGKSRFDLLDSSLKEKEETIKREKDFYNSITTKISTLLDNILQDNKNNQESFTYAMDLMKKKIKENSNTINEKVEKLEEFNISSYNSKMEKIDRIVDTFDKLLKD